LRVTDAVVVTVNRALLLVGPINEPGFDGAVKWACDRKAS